MESREIENALRGRIGPYVNYKGVYTSDYLPFISYSAKPVIIIANTLSSRADISIVGHWVAFYISFYPSTYILFFDSYGLSPHLYTQHFSHWLGRYSKYKIQEFRRQVQPDNSQKCGLYVIHFTHYTSYFGIDKYRNFFKNNFSRVKLHFNDVTVTRYYFNRIVKNNNSCSRWRKNKRSDKNAITYKECLSYKR